MNFQPTATVNPATESIAELASCSFAGPIAMLNLLRYEGEEGRAAYGRYAQVAVDSVGAVGGSLMYLGQVIDPDHWDTIAVVYYPSAAAYVTMQSDENYIAAIAERTAGLRARLLWPFELPDIGPSEAAEIMACEDSETLQFQLVKGTTGPSLSELDHLRLKSVGVGLVADQEWAQLLVTKQPARDPEPGDKMVIVSRRVGEL